MNFLLETALASLLAYKYLALFAITFFSAFALPVPSGPALVTAAALAEPGYFDLALIFLAAFSGSVAGNLVSYWLARLYGKRVTHWLGFKRVSDSPWYALLKKQMHRHRFVVIFFSRFQSLAAVAGNVLSGLVKIPFRDYLGIMLLGELAQACAYTIIGHVFGIRWHGESTIANKVALAIVPAAFLALVLARKRILRKYG
jgi:membrane protein DedA with SNARE-associated domain